MTRDAGTHELADLATEGLGRRTVRGGVVVFASVVLQKIAAFGVMMVLARILTKVDYGLIGMVLAFTAFIQVFSDLGLTMATVQKRELTGPQLSTLFWFNLALSILLTGIAAAAAPGMAWFYGEPRLVRIALLASAGFFLAGLGMQHTALMMRRMQFGRIAACELAALAAGGATGIVMALRGWGAYALVGQALAQTLTRSLAAWTLAAWVPGLPVRGSGIREALRFGGYLTGFNLLNYFSRNTDRLLLGRFWGAAPVGIYTRAYTLMTYPITLVSAPMGRVMIPALSRLQHDDERYAQAHLRAMRVLAFLSFPLAAGMAVMAEDAVLVAFGPRWAEVVPIFRVLCIAGIFQGWMNSLGWLYVSAGKTRNMFLLATFAAPLRVIGFLPAIWFGALGAAVGYAAVTILLMPVGLWYAARSTGVLLLPLVRAAAGPLAATGIMCACVYLLRAYVLAEASLSIRAVGLVGAGAVCFLLAAVVLAPSVVREAMAMAKDTLPGLRPAAGPGGDR
ncbi:MAG: lipopolysaccharide biosynthesis protein [Planctomycetota bacterium]|jgi:PST family polysaccharide transporter